MLERRESRPVASRTATSSTAIKNKVIVPATPDQIVEPERCRECGHVITSVESIEVGIGRDCRRRLRAAAREAVAA